MKKHVSLEKHQFTTILEAAVSGFYQEVKILQSVIGFNEISNGCGELSFQALFDHAIRSLESEEILTINQFYEKKDSGNGVFDLLVLNRKNSELNALIECKYQSSNENEPSSEYWKPKNTEAYYDKVERQAMSYMKNSTLFKNDSVPYIVVLTFSVVKFDDKGAIEKWQFYDGLLENEFYEFVIFTEGGINYGLAVYGRIKSLN